MDVDVNRIDEKIDNHECRIQKLELNDATIFERVDNLIKSQESLIGWVKALIVVIALSLLGLLIDGIF